MSSFEGLSPKEARTRATQTIALAKWMKDSVSKQVDPAMDAAKEWLSANDMDPGAKIPALVDGEEIATISRAKITESTTVSVVDQEAFADWLTSHGHEVEWDMTLKPYLTSKVFLEKLLESLEPNEIPDGVEVDSKARGGFISVRQTEAQALVLSERFEAVRAVQEQFAQLGIEASDE